MKAISSFFFLIITLTLCLTLQPHLIIAHQTNSTNLITEVCSHCLYKDLCVSSFESDPNGQHAADVTGLALIAHRLAISHATHTSVYIGQLLNDSNLDPSIEQCLHDCSEQYLDAIEQLDDSLAALTAKGYNDVNTWVTAAMSDAATCEEGFKEQAGQASVLTERNNVFNQLCSNTLAISNLLAGI